MATTSIPTLTVNIGRPDRAIRIAIGVIILMLGLLWASWWGLVGLVPLGTGLVGFCPLYRLLGMRTTWLDRTR